MKGTQEKSDVRSELFCIDVKVRRRWSILEWFRQLKKEAGNKVPILVVRKPKAKTRLAIVEFDFLIAILKAAELVSEQAPEQAKGQLPHA